MFVRLAYSVTGPMAWNLLRVSHRDPTCSSDSFRRNLETFVSLYILAYTAYTDALQLCDLN